MSATSTQPTLDLSPAIEVTSMVTCASARVARLAHDLIRACPAQRLAVDEVRWSAAG